MSSPYILNPRSWTFNVRRLHTRTLSTMASTPTPLAEPPKGTVRSHRNRDLALQKYLLLQEEHDQLREHLDALEHLRLVPPSTLCSALPHNGPQSPTSTTFTTSSWSSQTNPLESVYSSLPESHGQGHRRLSLPAASSRPVSSISAASGLDTVVDESTITEMAADEARLCDINEGIKRVLTELLNCEAVRADRAFRTWVQCRLMDTERELRTGRRRRSAPDPFATAYP